MYYMVVTVYNIIWHIRCDNVKNEIIGCLIMDEIVGQIMSTKKRMSGNTQHATYSILNYQFRSAIFNFLFDNAENDTVWYHIQVK